MLTAAPLMMLVRELCRKMVPDVDAVASKEIEEFTDPVREIGDVSKCGFKAALRVPSDSDGRTRVVMLELCGRAVASVAVARECDVAVAADVVVVVLAVKGLLMDVAAVNWLGREADESRGEACTRKAPGEALPSRFTCDFCCGWSGEVGCCNGLASEALS